MIRATWSALIVTAWLISAGQAMAGKPTVPYSEDSVEKGRRLFQIHCPACHGRDGRARIDFVSDATDLTTPARYRNGATPTDVFSSLADGAGTDMPPFQYTLPNVDDRWHLINFIISTWTPDERVVFLGDQ